MTDMTLMALFQSMLPATFQMDRPQHVVMVLYVVMATMQQMKSSKRLDQMKIRILRLMGASSGVAGNSRTNRRARCQRASSGKAAASLARSDAVMMSSVP